MTQNHISTLETKRATAHAWKAYFKRHETTKNPGIHYSMIIDTAEEYLYAREYMFSKRVEHGYTKGMECWVGRYPDINGACNHMDSLLSKLHDMCLLIGVSSDAAIRIAKLRIHSYDTMHDLTGSLWHDDSCRKALDRIS